MSKTPKRSAGLLMYHKPLCTVEVFLLDPGGHIGLTGEYKTDERLLAAAIPKVQHPEL